MAAEQPPAQLAPAAPAAETQGFCKWWESGVTADNAALVAFALLAFQKWLDRNWFEAAFVATGTYGLARQKLYDPRRAQWLGFTLGFLLRNLGSCLCLLSFSLLSCGCQGVLLFLDFPLSLGLFFLS